MEAGLLAQYVVIAVVATGSIGYVIKTQWPGATRRARVACALALMASTRPAWMQRIGRRLAPAASTTSSCGGCSSCD